LHLLSIRTFLIIGATLAQIVTVIVTKEYHILFFCKSAAGGILAFSAIRLAAAAGGILRYLTTVRNPIRNGRSKAKFFCMFVLKLKNMNM
jgi:hypothetical protein